MCPAVDWGDGAYEVFSPSLGPAAQRLVEVAAPRPGERAIDLGAGDGNATLPLAQSGARVTAVDPSRRLLNLAGARVRAAGQLVTSVKAGAESLPLPDDDADLIISNFGVIFTPDPAAAIAEIDRVLRPTGRFLYTAWLPVGPLSDIRQSFQAAFPAAPSPDDPPRVPPLAWHEAAAVADLVPGHTATVTLRREQIDFHAPSARAFNDEQAEYHPMWRAMRAALGDERRWARLMDASVAILEAGVPTGSDRFVVRSEYVIGELRTIAPLYP